MCHSISTEHCTSQAYDRTFVKKLSQNCILIVANGAGAPVSTALIVANSASVPVSTKLLWLIVRVYSHTDDIVLVIVYCRL